jgi:hypothetical protein
MLADSRKTGRKLSRRPDAPDAPTLLYNIHGVTVKLPSAYLAPSRRHRYISDATNTVPAYRNSMIYNESRRGVRSDR